MQPPVWYNILLSCLKPLYLWRIRKRAENAEALQLELKQRFGSFLPVKNKNTIWFHAVSVGETNAAQPLIEHYLSQGQAVLVTNTTKTGQARAKSLFEQQYPHLFQAVFLPVDQKKQIKAFVELYQPKILLLIETELWPNLLACVAQAKIPRLLLNARLSEKSANGYRKLKVLTLPMLEQLNWIATQDTATATRFHQLGKAENQMSILGNIKFDISAPQDLQTQITPYQTAFEHRRVVVLASTHASEEVDILTALRSDLINDSGLLCIVVPRHPERFDEVFEVIHALNLTVKRRSLNEIPNAQTQVYLADSMGELWYWYALADVAYVGGSLNASGGGHNILEPLSLNLPTVIGHRYFNFQTIVDEFLKEDAICVVQDATQAKDALLHLLNNTDATQKMVSRARQTIQSYQGVLTHYINLIEKFLPK